jgi:hypothetical protein
VKQAFERELGCLFGRKASPVVKSAAGLQPRSAQGAISFFAPAAKLLLIQRNSISHPWADCNVRVATSPALFLRRWDMELREQGLKTWISTQRVERRLDPDHDEFPFVSSSPRCSTRTRSVSKSFSRREALDLHKSAGHRSRDGRSLGELTTLHQYHPKDHRGIDVGDHRPEWRSSRRSSSGSMSSFSGGPNFILPNGILPCAGRITKETICGHHRSS